MKPSTGMNLKVLLPFRIFAQKTGVSRIVAEGDGVVFVAVDVGVLIKTGPDVLVSVRNAMAGTDLGRLRAAVEREFVNRDALEQSVRSVLTKIESGFMRRLVEFHHER